jgi:hypothetical protein
MITALLQTTDAVIGASLPVTTRHIIASLQEGQPVIHTGNGNFAPIANDLNGFWSYQRIRGEVSVTATVLAGDPCQALQASVPLRIVALLDRDGCEDIAASLAAALRASTKQAEAVTGAYSVDFDRVAWTFDTNKSQEFAASVTIPLTKTLLVMDVQITVRGKASCMIVCDPVDVTCAIIAEASNAKVVECLGPDRVAQICDSTPCPPTTVNGTESDTPTITVLQGGEQVGTLNPATGVHTVPECEEGCTEPYTLRWQIGETIFDILVNSDPCGGSDVLTCDTLIDAVVVEGAGLSDSNGLYLPNAGGYQNPSAYRIDSEGDPVRWTIKDDDSLLRYDTTPSPTPWDAEQWFVAGDDEPAPTVRQATIGDLCPCEEPEPCPLDLVINGDPFATVADPCDDPTLSIQVRQSTGSTQVGSQQGSHWRIGDSEISINGTVVADVMAEDSLNIPVVQGGSPVGSWNGTQWVVPPCDTLCDLLGDVEPADAQNDILDCVTEATEEAIRVILSPLKFGWGPGDADTLEWEITSDEAGTYGTYTQDGSSGTITYSLNGGAFAAVSGTIVLAAGDDIIVRRTSPSLTGFSKWAA